MTDVVLVNMPFAALERPSLALSTLKAVLVEAGISCAVRYPNLDIGARIGAHTYQMLARVSVDDCLLEWAFTKAAFPGHEPDPKPFADFVYALPKDIMRRMEPDDGHEGVWRKVAMLREDAAAFIDRTARAILAGKPRIVGCTSTFQQHIASIALLRRIRELDPDVVTMMGGSNCETRMGRATHKDFPWIDYVVSGEADTVIVPLCRQAMRHGRDAALEDLPDGVIAPAHRLCGYRFRDSGRDGVPRALVEAVGDLPVPDMSDYFAALDASPLRSAIGPALVVETSRGCWWGALQHCTFCGLNGSSMTFRTKTPDRAYAEFDALTGRYGIDNIHVADNILDMAYFPTLIAKLGEVRNGWNIFYETKANLNREQVAALSGAGVRWFQPGIESLHTSALKLMGKGTTSWRNVLLLKWARRYGLYVVWFLLWGMPGEEDAWFAEVAGWLPAIAHLQPSNGVSKISYDRYSPYFNKADTFGLDLKPSPRLRDIYPVAEAELADHAYFFEDANEEIADHPSWRIRSAPRPGVKALHLAHNRWREEAATTRPVLSFVDAGGALTITDTRSCAVRATTTLTDAAREIYLACEDGPTTARLATRLAGRSVEDIETALEALRIDRLLLRLDGHHVALAIEEPIAPDTARLRFPGGEVRFSESRRIERALLDGRSLVDQLLELA